MNLRNLSYQTYTGGDYNESLSKMRLDLFFIDPLIQTVMSDKLFSPVRIDESTHPAILQSTHNEPVHQRQTTQNHPLLLPTPKPNHHRFFKAQARHEQKRQQSRQPKTVKSHQQRHQHRNTGAHFKP